MYAYDAYVHMYRLYVLKTNSGRIERTAMHKSPLANGIFIQGYGSYTLDCDVAGHAECYNCCPLDWVAVQELDGS